MKLIQYPAGSVWATDAANWLGLPDRTHLNIAITAEALQRRLERGVRWQLGQLYGIVCPGAINAEFAYQGLKRRMFVADNPEADAEKLALTWRPQSDFMLAGDQFAPTLSPTAAPPGRVFVVYLSPNHMKDRFAEVDAWIEHWTWVDEDPNERGRPIDWRDRYQSCIWPNA